MLLLPLLDARSRLGVCGSASVKGGMDEMKFCWTATASFPERGLIRKATPLLESAAAVLEEEEDGAVKGVSETDVIVVSLECETRVVLLVRDSRNSASAAALVGLADVVGMADCCCC